MISRKLLDEANTPITAGAPLVNFKKTSRYQQIMKQLEKMAKERDYEGPHYDADLLLCKVLMTLGYGELVKRYNDVGKWYA